MGNIHREVCPIRVIFRLRRESKAVKVISRHHPVSPHLKKFLKNVFIIFTVCGKKVLFMHERYGN